MTNSENSSTTQSHGKLIAVVVAAAVVIILAVLSAFVWPGWAIQKNDGTSTTTQNSQQKTESSEPTKPTIDATALPDASTTWNSASPLEEYTLTYSTGDAAKDVTLVAAQWSSADNAKTQYDALVAAQTGDESASGNVKVSGNVTGAYVVKADASNSKNAVAIWQNDTVVFQATGTKEAVDRFYQKFPM